MAKSVLVALADGKYLTQAKQLFATAYWNSGWSGDYLLLAYDTADHDLAWFSEKGIRIKHCPPRECGSNRIGDKITACKCLLFSEYFKQWENVVYLDVDIVTRGSIDGLIGLTGFAACTSLGQTLKDNLVHFANIPQALANDLQSNFNLNEKAFNSGVMAFPTSIIHAGMYEELMATFVRYVNVGSWGGDQLPLNLYFHNKWVELPVAYNQITPLGERSYDPGKLQGLIIHCVSFGNGPWDSQSALHGEWRSNLERAGLIDLRSIPKVPVPPRAEVEKRSALVVRAHLMRGAANAANVFRLFLRGLKLAVTHPKRVAGKLRMMRRPTLSASPDASAGDVKETSFARDL
jgi:hypothetical protein